MNIEYDWEWHPKDWAHDLKQVQRRISLPGLVCHINRPEETLRHPIMSIKPGKSLQQLKAAAEERRQLWKRFPLK